MEDNAYIKRVFQTCEEDRPLFVQFCANDPQTLLSAARLVEDHCDAIDINLGCPQGIAKRGQYGSFLLESTDLIVYDETTYLWSLRTNLLEKWSG